MQSIQRVLFIPDVHVPNHHRTAWSVCLNAVASWKPHRVVFLGDFADDECVSSHSKSPDRNRLLKREMVGVTRELDRAEAVFEKAKVNEVDVLGGNHEDRLDRYIADRAPELFGLVSMPDLMDLERRGWHWHPYKTSIRVGKLTVTHDFGFAGPGAAAQNLAACGHSCITGHTHRAGIVYGGHSNGERQVSVVSGWLGDPREAAKYKHFDRAMREWQHGFTTAEILKDGTAFVNFHPIIRGKTVVGGRVVTG